MAKEAQAKSRKWIVTVTATFTASDTVEIEASTENEAKQKALESRDVNFDIRNVRNSDPDKVEVTDIEEEDF
jgi:hypothetical protein